MLDEKLLILFLFLSIPLAMRIRRELGFQNASSRRILVRRIGLPILALFLTLLLGGREPVLAVLTWAISVSLTSLSLRITTFDRRPDGMWFRANPWIGGSLAALLVGRIAYRVYYGMSLGDLTSMQDGTGLESMGRSPISLMIALLLLSHFGLYYNLVVRKAAGFPDGPMDSF